MDMPKPIELVVLTPAFGLRNVSPFCLKIEMLLAALELPFEIRPEADPRQAPKGKLPFVVIDGVALADSELIAVHLDELTEGGVYGSLSPVQIAQGRAITRLVEDHLYWIMVASRWLDDSWWPNIVEGFFGSVPKLMRGVVANSARKSVRRGYALQGLGRHTRDEQQLLARQDLAALEALVTQTHGAFLFGREPGVFDFAVAGFMVGALENQPPTWFTTVALEYKGLVQYTERVQDYMGIYGRFVDGDATPAPNDSAPSTTASDTSAPTSTDAVN